jgi:hypothetical protein
VFESPVGSKEIVVTDSNAHIVAPVIPQGESKGREARDWTRVPFGSPPFQASANPLPTLIPRSEWDARIKELTESPRLLSKRRTKAGIKSLDQNGTNYCWGNAVVSAMKLMRLKANQPYANISPASGCAVIKRGANQGGWGGEMLQFIIDTGLCTTALWGANDRNYRSLETDAVKAEREKFKVAEWWEVPQRGFDTMMTLLLHEIPVFIGLNWWSHEVCAVDPVIISASAVNESHAAAKERYKHLPSAERDPLIERAASKYGTRIWNSWGDSWSDEGMGLLNESKSTPDDAGAPSVSTPG